MANVRLVFIPTASDMPTATDGGYRVTVHRGDGVTLAELLSGIVHDHVEGTLTRPLPKTLREAWGSLEQRPFPYPDSIVTSAANTLRTLAERWSRLAPEEGLEFTWPPRLTAPFPTKRR